MQSDPDIEHRLTIKTLGRYQIQQRIGKGGMGDVWLGEDPRLHRQVAIKTLPIQQQNDQEFSERFDREAQAAAALNHPHILPIHDYGEQPLPDGRVITYIVMPYIAGGSLAERIKRLKAAHSLMVQQEALAYLSQAAEAIDYAHQQGIIHRDIKPANMLLRPDNWLLLSDFGIARILTNPDVLTRTGASIGTPEYMAPEQARGKAEAASDTYGLAVIAYQLFTGQLPFTAETSYGMVIQHITMAPTPPMQINPRLTAGLEEVLLRGLGKEPAQRFPSARAFVAELARHVTEMSTQSASAQQTVFSNTVLADTLIDREQTEVAAGQNSHLAPTLLPDSSKAPEPANKTRRNVLMGGVGALVTLGAGAGIWEFVTYRNAQTGQKTTPANVTSQTTPANVTDPDGPFAKLEHSHAVYSMNWSPKENMLLSASEVDGMVRLWDLRDLQPQQTKTLVSKITPGSSANPVKFNVVKLAWSTDGNFIAVGNFFVDNAPFGSTFISVYTANLGANAPGYDKPVMVSGYSLIDELNWTDAGHVVIVGTPSDISATQPQLTIIDITKPQAQFKPVTLSNEILSPSLLKTSSRFVSPDGKSLAIPVANGVLIGQLLTVGNELKWQPHGDRWQVRDMVPVGQVSWAWNSKVLVGLSDETKPALGVWDLGGANYSASLLGLSAPDTILSTVAWCQAPTSTLIAAGSKTGEIYLWDNAKGSLPVRTLKSGTIKTPVLALGWSADGQWLAASYDNGAILIWKIGG
ncbi:MAG TPA: serine/threonine-protein kinase [Ktedonosporobacter sp.]|nr:serine/threonine-protein kinase [Ktedonosporobacter sp.]